MNREIVTIKFSDIAESLEFPEFCKILSELLNLNAFSLKQLDTKGPGKVLSPKLLNSLCKFIQEKKEGTRRCLECDRIHIEKAWETQEPIQYICHAGLRDFVVPIVVNHEMVAVFEGGQFLPKKPTEEDFLRFRRGLRDLKLDEKRLRELYFKSPFISKKKLDQVIKLIFFFSKYLSECLKHTNRAYRGRKHSAVTDACAYIQGHYKEAITLEQVADSVFLSPSYLSSLFTKQTDTHLTDYIQSLRVNEAKKLLEKTQLSITKIAYEVGFSSLSHFYRVYKKYEKICPKEYRKKLQEES
jgi:AraC-like DNA-binding protein